MSSDHTWTSVLSHLVEGSDLSISESTWAMQSVMAGEATSAQLGGLLVALRIKGETVAQIVGFRDAVIAAAPGIPLVKHGTRGASSASGVSNVLAAFGLNREIPPERVAAVLREP